MTVLADCDIERYRRIGLLDIAPWSDELLQPVSYDLTLAPYVTSQSAWIHRNVYGDITVDKVEWHTDKFDEYRMNYVLQPDEFALFSTVEKVTLGNNLVGHVEGKSTIARHGILVHCAGLVDPGFEGELTLEVKNLSKIPFVMTAGMRIAQIEFSQTLSNVRRTYGSPGLDNHYQGQKGPTPPYDR